MHEVRISLGLHEFLLEANVIRPTISAGLLHTDLAIKEQSGTLLLQHGFLFIYIYIYHTSAVTLANEQKYLNKINK